MPGGALAVEDGDTIVPLVNALARRFASVVVIKTGIRRGMSLSPLVVMMVPSRSKRSASTTAIKRFGRIIASRALPGAELHPDLALDLAFLILRKGMHKGVDFYSAFVEADGKTTTGLAAMLKPAAQNASSLVALQPTIAWRYLRSTRAPPVSRLS